MGWTERRPCVEAAACWRDRARDSRRSPTDTSAGWPSDRIGRQRHRLTAISDFVVWPQLADTVEKLLFRSYSKNSRPVDALLLPGREGPGDLPLHATRVGLINAATIRGVNCRLQRTDARIRGHCNLEFFNRIGRSATVGH